MEPSATPSDAFFSLPKGLQVVYTACAVVVCQRAVEYRMLRGCNMPSREVSKVRREALKNMKDWMKSESLKADQDVPNEKF